MAMRVDCKTSGTGWDAEPWHQWVEHGIIYSGECGKNEPWVHSGGFQVGTCEDRDGFSNEERDQQNAARIVSCVNACAGIADPAATLREVRKAIELALAIETADADALRSLGAVVVAPDGRIDIEMCSKKAADVFRSVLAKLPKMEEE